MYEKCLQVLTEQIAALQEAAAVQKSVQSAVYEKKWADFECAGAALSLISLKIQSLEDERIGIIGNVDFYVFAASFSASERDVLCDAFRNLKLESAKIRFAAASFNNYLSEASLIVQGFLDAAFPDRKGKLYCKSGSVRRSDMRSIVLDKQF